MTSVPVLGLYGYHTGGSLSTVVGGHRNSGCSGFNGRHLAVADRRDRSVRALPADILVRGIGRINCCGQGLGVSLGQSDAGLVKAHALHVVHSCIHGHLTGRGLAAIFGRHGD